MPITFEIHPAQHLISIRYQGAVSIADIRASMLELLAHPSFAAGLDVLANVSGMKANFNSAETVQHRDWRRQFPRFGKMAIVAGTDYEFGIARMFEMGTEGIGGTAFEVFRDMAAARKWLGLPDA